MPNGEEKLDVSQIQAAVRDAGAEWLPGVTPLSELPREERIKRLGLTPPPGEMTLEQVEEIVRALRGAPRAMEKAVGAPAAYDLRNVNGQNFITPIRNQGSCGSCVAFGACAAIEGTLRKQRNDPNFQVDLSEAHLYYCHAAAQNANCSTGWWPEKALDCCKNPGIADEACFPYTAGNQACNVCADWQNRVVKLTGHHKVTSAADMKTWISTKGPVSACLIVYDDFFSYKTGVYRHVTGSQAGGHCICLIGYDDGQGCWIGKNSWSTGWGESGFFRIAYGDCGIDTWDVRAVDGVIETETAWLNNKKVIGLWTIDQDRNAWVCLDGGVGWRRIAFDNDNIFFNLLVQLTSAKAANRPVNVYQEQGVIKQVYVL